MYFKVGQTDILHYQIEVWVRFRFHARAPRTVGSVGPWNAGESFSAIYSLIYPLAKLFAFDQWLIFMTHSWRVRIYESFFLISRFISRVFSFLNLISLTCLNVKFRFIHIGLSEKCNNRQFCILVFNNRTKWRYYRQPELSGRRHAKK